MQIHISVPPVTARVIKNVSKKKSTKDDTIKIAPSVECGLPSNSNSHVDAHPLFLFIISIYTGRWKVNHMFEKKYCVFLHYIFYCIYFKYIIIRELIAILAK
jgi:hypothetical protein